MNKKIIISVSTIIILVLFSFVVFKYKKNSYQKNVAVNEQVPVSVMNTDPDLQTYRNKELGFEINIPKTWVAYDEDSNGVSFYDSVFYNLCQKTKTNQNMKVDKCEYSWFTNLAISPNNQPLKEKATDMLGVDQYNSNGLSFLHNFDLGIGESDIYQIQKNDGNLTFSFGTGGNYNFQWTQMEKILSTLKFN